jgi:predicted RNase H-like nuclease
MRTERVVPANQAEAWVAGVDGCPAGWVAFKVDLRARETMVEVVDLQSWLRSRPNNLAILAIDMPIGLVDGPRPCDCAARKLLGSPRCSSVFAAPCRVALDSISHASASERNRNTTGKGLSIQAWAIAAKIKEIDDILLPEHETWVFEIHPEVSFWRMNGRQPMDHSKRRSAGREERHSILSREFPDLDRHIQHRPGGVGVDDLFDAAAAAWSALRLWKGKAESVCLPSHDARGLKVAIHY